MDSNSSQSSVHKESRTTETNAEESNNVAETSSTPTMNPAFLPISNEQINSLVRGTIDETTESFLKKMEKLIPLRRGQPHTYENNNQASTSRGKYHHRYRDDHQSRHRPSKRYRSLSTDREYVYEGDLTDESYDSQSSYSDSSDSEGEDAYSQEAQEYNQDRESHVPSQNENQVYYASNSGNGPRGKASDCETVFNDKGEFFVKYDEKTHKILDQNKILWDEEVIDIKWHPTKPAFCRLRKVTRPHECIYIDPEAGHQSVTGLFSLEHNITDTPFLNRKCFDTTLNSGSGLDKFLHIMMATQEAVLFNLCTNNEAAAMKAIPDKVFETVSMANFTSGWPASSTYIAWAKGINLCTKKAGLGLTMDREPIVHNDILDEEKLARSRVANLFTGFKMIELFAERFKSDPSISSAIMAIAQQFLPTLRDLTLAWMVSKMEVRKAILLGRSNLAARLENLTVRQLLQSNMWDPNVFPQDILDRFSNDGPSKNISAMINPHLSEERSRTWKSRNHNRRGVKRRRYEQRSQRNDYQDPDPFRNNQGRKDHNKNKKKGGHRKGNPISYKERGNRDFSQSKQNNQQHKPQKFNKKGRDSSSSKSKTKRRDHK